MKHISVLFLVLFVISSNFLTAQVSPKQPASKTSHFILAEALAVNYTFHHKFLNDRSRLGFGLTAGFGFRFPIINSTFKMNFDGVEGIYSLDAFQETYIEMLKLQVIYGYYLCEDFFLQISPYVSFGSFGGDFTNTLNVGVEGAIFYCYNWFVAGLRIQTGYYSFSDYSFYPVLASPTVGIRF